MTSLFLILLALGCHKASPNIIGVWKIDPESAHGPTIDFLRGHDPDRYNELMATIYEFKSDGTLTQTTGKTTHWTQDGRDITLDSAKTSSATVTPDGQRIHIMQPEQMGGPTILELIRE